MVPQDLNDEERRRYEWQLWTPGFGEAGQRKLKGATVLVSRLGGVGGAAAYELAAAGIGKLILAHGGNLRESDLNRQLLMTHAWLGKPRVESARARLLELNPLLQIEAVPENVSATNAARLIESADLIVDCAPLFQERLAMNREAVRQKKPLVECAMYDLEAQVTTILPGKTPCLRCLHPEIPAAWKREFPVFGAVAGTIGCLGALEAIKVLAGLGEPLYGRMLLCELRTMAFRMLTLKRDPQCPECRGA